LILVFKFNQMNFESQNFLLIEFIFDISLAFFVIYIYKQYIYLQIIKKSSVDLISFMNKTYLNILFWHFNNNLNKMINQIKIKSKVLFFPGISLLNINMTNEQL